MSGVISLLSIRNDGFLRTSRDSGPRLDTILSVAEAAGHWQGPGAIEAAANARVMFQVPWQPSAPKKVRYIRTKETGYK